MLRGYNLAALHRHALLLFRRMRRSGLTPTPYTLPLLLHSSSALRSSAAGQSLHCLAFATGLASDPFVAPALIRLYSATPEIARKVLDDMPTKHVVAATAAVQALLAAGDAASARDVFDRAEDPDAVLWNTMVSGYARRGDMASARELFDRAPPSVGRDVMSWNAVLLGYATAGDMASSERILLEEMPRANVFSWNALIAGYGRIGRFSDAFHAFLRMISDGVSPDSASLVALLSASSKLGALHWGRRIHSYAEARGFQGDLYVGNGLVDMYAKCGCIDDASAVFRGMHTHDLVSWNSMVGGLAMHGFGARALELFERLKQSRDPMTPDGVTFVGVLGACVHMGLVDVGFAHFRSMSEDYSIVPWMEHYGCMVDLLGRAGMLCEATDLVRRMPMQPDSVIWTALLAACQLLKNDGLAEQVVSRLVRLEPPEDVTNYLVLSNIYGAVGRRKDAISLKRLVRERGMGKGNKIGGCSWVGVKSEVVVFCSSDARHPMTEEIYGALVGMTELSKLAGRVPELDVDEICEAL